MSTTDSLLAFASEHWMMTLAAMWVMVCALKIIAHVYIRTLRVLIVSVRGWPPDHLDTDGDWKPREESRE
jgi:hypothetical protein